MKKGYTRFAAALLTVSMISTMSLSTFAAKVIKPSSKQNEEQTETVENSAPSTKSASSTAKSELSFTPKTYKLGKTQLQVPKNWDSVGDETALMFTSPISDSITSLMAVTLYDMEDFSAANGQIPIISPLTTDPVSIRAEFVALSKKIEGKSASESKAILDEYSQPYKTQGAESFEFINNKNYPGIKLTMPESDGMKVQAILMIGDKEVILMLGIADIGKSYNSADSTLNSIISTVKTVK